MEMDTDRLIEIGKGIFEFFMEILETIVFIGTLFIVIYLYVVQPNQVKGLSMDPTFQSGDYIFTSKITYRFRKHERGDIVVFKSPRNPDIEYIKRIIGIPGDTVVVKNNVVTVNGRVLEESYINQPTELWDFGVMKEGVPVVVPENHLVVFGDNRPRSSDSREFGPIPMDSLVGQVFYRYYPSKNAGWMENPFPQFFRTMNNPNISISSFETRCSATAAPFEKISPINFTRISSLSFS